MGLKNESRMYSNGYCFWRCRKNIENAKNKISEAMKERVRCYRLTRTMDNRI